MAVTCYCPSCWREVGKVSVCPACGAELRPFSEESFEEKLIRALNHPEPSTPIRAATILGRRRSTAAVEPLIALGLSTSDPYIQEAVAMALGEIGDPRARECLERLRREGALRVRLAAEKAARGLETAPNATGS